MFRKVIAAAVKNGRRLLDDVVRIQKGKAPNKKVFDRDIGIADHAAKHQVRWSLQTIPNRWIENFAGNRRSMQKLAYALRQKTNFGLPFGSATIFRKGCGSRIPLYAFVSLGFVTGSESEKFNTGHFDKICTDIQNLFKPELESESRYPSEKDPNCTRIEDFEIGPMISKGCAAAVHEAKLKERKTVENVEIYDSDEEAKQLDSFELMDLSVHGTVPNETVREEKYDLALKVMFNYDCESNGYAIKNGMEKEIVPAKDIIVETPSLWNNGRHPKKKRRLMPHPGIIEIKEVVVDDMQPLDGSLSEYPDSLPLRLNPYGFGRNKTLFIVMKKYPFTLEEYVLQKDLSLENSVLMFSQLLEAVLHLNNSLIAHRDLKSNNILVEEVGGAPNLVITDFGCCFDGMNLGLKVPYPCDDMGKGGNFALMAPEIVNARPGPQSFLDYSKSDLWAVGTLAYEIFGEGNPFYWRTNSLQSQNYDEKDLPNLPDVVPDYLQNLVKSMLTRNPDKRPDNLQVANAIQVILWAPKQWLTSLQRGKMPPCKIEVMRWLLTLTAQYMLEQDGTIVHKLRGLFLSRLDLEDVMDAIYLLWNLSSVD